jgi:hypothetical protein
MQFQAHGGINILGVVGTVYHWVDVLSGPVLGLAIVIWAIRKYLAFRWHRTQPTILFELTPPASSKRTPHATEQFLMSLHSLGRHLTFSQRLLGRTAVFSLELPASRRKGIRYAVRVRVTRRVENTIFR